MKPRFRLRYCGPSWKGPEWCIERRVLCFWFSHHYVYGEQEEAEAEMARFETHP